MPVLEQTDLHSFLFPRAGLKNGLISRTPSMKDNKKTETEINSFNEIVR